MILRDVAFIVIDYSGKKNVFQNESGFYEDTVQ